MQCSFMLSSHSSNVIDIQSTETEINSNILRIGGPGHSAVTHCSPIATAGVSIATSSKRTKTVLVYHRYLSGSDSMNLNIVLVIELVYMVLFLSIILKASFCKESIVVALVCFFSLLLVLLSILPSSNFLRESLVDLLFGVKNSAGPVEQLVSVLLMFLFATK